MRHDRASDISSLLGCAKGSKHGGESLAGDVRGGAPLNSAARNLKPNTDDDIGRQLRLVYGQSSLGNRLGEVRLLTAYGSPLVGLLDVHERIWHRGRAPGRVQTCSITMP